MTEESKIPPSREKAEEIIRTLYRKLAKDINWIDVRGLSGITDDYIVATGRSGTHVQALADEMELLAERQGWPAPHMEGRGSGEWLLVDFTDVIVHLFGREAREFYRFERLYPAERFLPIDALKAQVTEENTTGDPTPEI